MTGHSAAHGIEADHCFGGQFTRFVKRSPQGVYCHPDNAKHNRVQVNQISLRFYEELNDFLPPDLRKQTIQHRLERRASVKDVIESFHVPHPEIEIILVNGQSVDFSYLVKPGDRISVYPVFESLDVYPLLKLRPDTLRTPRFVIDSNLGRLARYLRLLGFDALYSNSYDDARVAAIADQQQRIVLTRDRFLLHRKIITHGYFVREVHPVQQAAEVIRRFDLKRLITPFSRCIGCNGQLHDVEKGKILDRLEPNTLRFYDHFRRCESCRQIYWAGGHHERALGLIRRILDDGKAAD